jgi:TM2 domain-containing membrane protein YozV
MREERSVGMAYMLWIPCLFGLCGIHRFYAGRWATGLLWFFTGGLCFVGQLVDLFLIPGMVDAYNRGESRL